MSDDELIIELKEDVVKLRSQSRALKSSSDRLRAQMETLYSQVQRMDDRSNKFHSDLTYTQQQLESVIGSLEREHDIIADHAERLRLVADENSKYRDKRYSSNSTQSLLVILTLWLYTPAMYLVKGVYSLLSPLVYTVHSLSLFNSDIIYKLSNFAAEEEPTTRDIRRDNLFTMLQNGKLDPPSVTS